MLDIGTTGTTIRLHGRAGLLDGVLPFAEYSSSLIGQVRAVTAEPTDCPCFREPYVIPDSFSSSDQRHWKFKQAWRNGRPLLFDKRLGFSELEARGPLVYTEPIFGLEKIAGVPSSDGGESFAVTYGKTPLQLDEVIYDDDGSRYNLYLGRWHLRDSSTIRDDDPFFQTFQDRNLVGTYVFWQIDIVDEGDIAIRPTLSLETIEGDEVDDLVPYGTGFDTSAFNEDGVYSKRTAEYYPSNQFFNIGEEEGCEPKPCFLTIQPEYICSEPTDNPVVTTQSICSGVLDGNPVFSANSIRLENDCFKICDTPPCLKRRQ